MGWTRAILALPLAVFVLAGGCGGAKQGDCSKLMGHINEGLSQLENAQQQRKNDPSQASLRAMAENLDQIAGKTAQLQLTVPEVKAIAQRYEAMSRQIAKTSRELADANEKSDVAKHQKAQKELGDALKLEDPIIDDLNKLCSQ